METKDSHNDSATPAHDQRDRSLSQFFAAPREAYFAKADAVLAERGLADITRDELVRFLRNHETD